MSTYSINTMKKSLFKKSLTALEKQYDYDVERQQLLVKCVGADDVEMYNNEELYKIAVELIAEGFQHKDRAVEILNRFIFDTNFGRELNTGISYYDIIWDDIIRECKLKIDNE